MEHKEFFERKASAGSSATLFNVMSAIKQTEPEKAENGTREKPKLKVITADMPKWKQEKFANDNIIIAEEIKRIENSEKAEERKWSGVPGWKANIMRLKLADQKRKEDEETQARAQEEEEKKAFELLPPWRKSLLTNKGVTRIVTKLQETQETNNNVAMDDTNDSADSDTLDADHYSDTDEDVENIADDDNECQDNSETGAENGVNSETDAENEDNSEVAVENPGENEDHVVTEDQADNENHVNNEDNAEEDNCEQNDDPKASETDDDHAENGEVKVPDDDKMEVTFDVTEKEIPVVKHFDIE